MAADGRCRWRRQNFVNLLLLIAGVDCDEEERKVKRERELFGLEIDCKGEKGEHTTCISSSPQSTADAILFVYKPSPLGLSWAS